MVDDKKEKSESGKKANPATSRVSVKWRNGGSNEKRKNTKSIEIEKAEGGKNAN